MAFRLRRVGSYPPPLEGRCPSGQRELAVNQSLRLRRFESFPAHPSLAGGMTESAPVPEIVTVDVAPGTRMLAISDLALAWRPTDTSLAIASELAAVLDTWAGPGVLVFNGDMFALED